MKRIFVTVLLLSVFTAPLLLTGKAEADNPPTVTQTGGTVTTLSRKQVLLTEHPVDRFQVVPACCDRSVAWVDTPVATQGTVAAPPSTTEAIRVGVSAFGGLRWYARFQERLVDAVAFNLVFHNDSPFTARFEVRFFEPNPARSYFQAHPGHRWRRGVELEGGEVWSVLLNMAEPVRLLKVISNHRVVTQQVTRRSLLAQAPTATAPTVPPTTTPAPAPTTSIVATDRAGIGWSTQFISRTGDLVDFRLTLHNHNPNRFVFLTVFFPYRLPFLYVVPPGGTEQIAVTMAEAERRLVIKFRGSSRTWSPVKTSNQTIVDTIVRKAGILAG